MTKRPASEAPDGSRHIVTITPTAMANHTDVFCNRLSTPILRKYQVNDCMSGYFASQLQCEGFMSWAFAAPSDPYDLASSRRNNSSERRVPLLATSNFPTCHIGGMPYRNMGLSVLSMGGSQYSIKRIMNELAGTRCFLLWSVGEVHVRPGSSHLTNVSQFGNQKSQCLAIFQVIRENLFFENAGLGSFPLEPPYKALKARGI
jgi:hypothetical protein